MLIGLIKQRDCGSIAIYSLMKQGRHYAALSCLSISGNVKMWDLSGTAEDLHLYDWMSSFLCFKGFYCLWDIGNYWSIDTISHSRRRESAVTMLWQTKLWFHSFTLNVWLTVHLVFWVVKYIGIYTGCHRRNGPNFGRVFLMLNYPDITQNTYVQSWTVSEIMASEVWNFDTCYTLTDYQIHIETGRNMWFL